MINTDDNSAIAVIERGLRLLQRQSSSSSSSPEDLEKIRTSIEKAFTSLKIESDSCVAYPALISYSLKTPSLKASAEQYALRGIKAGKDKAARGFPG